MRLLIAGVHSQNLREGISKDLPEHYFASPPRRISDKCREDIDLRFSRGVHRDLLVHAELLGEANRQEACCSVCGGGGAAAASLTAEWNSLGLLLAARL